MVALIGCMSIAPAANAEVPRDFFGLSADGVFADEGAYRQNALERQAGAGVGILRRTFVWRDIETSPGVYDFDHYDRYVGDLAARGIRVLPIVFDPPDWHSSRPPGDDERGVYPPDDPASMGAFAGVLVHRYGPGGAFWQQHPGLPELPIRSWQVWNEPNYPYYWLGGINAAEYVDLLRATRDGIKAADPGAEVVTAGFVQSGSPKSVGLVDFMNQMYDAGALGTFDTLAMHPYAATPELSLGLLATTRAVMDARGDSSPIWATEFGWASGGPESSVTVDEGTHATYLAALMRGMLARRDSLRLRGMVWWNWADAPPYAGGKDYWGLHCGLLRIDGSDKPALTAFASIAADAAAPDPFALDRPGNGSRTRESRPPVAWQPPADRKSVV